MYRIKSKPGFNLVFKDPSLPRLNSSCDSWHYIDDEKFNNNEIQRVLEYIIFEKVDSVEVEKTIEKTNDNIVDVGNNIFVHNGHNDVVEPDQITTFAVKAPEVEIEEAKEETFETKVTEIAQETLVIEPITEPIAENTSETVEEATNETVEETTEVKKRGRKPKSS